MMETSSQLVDQNGNLAIDSHTELMDDLVLRVQLMYLKESVFVWASVLTGQDSPSFGISSVLPLNFGALAVSFPLTNLSSKSQSSVPAGTILIKSKTAEFSKSLAQRLAKRFDKVFYVSINAVFDESSMITLALVEKRIMAYILEKFNKES